MNYGNTKPVGGRTRIFVIDFLTPATACMRCFPASDTTSSESGKGRMLLETKLMTRSWRASASTALVVLLLALGGRCAEDQTLCESFEAKTAGVTNSTYVDNIERHEFTCKDGVFLKGFDMDRYVTWFVEGIRFWCTDWTVSDWYAGEDRTSATETFGVGVTYVRSQEVLNATAIDDFDTFEYDYPFMGRAFIGGYDLSSGALSDQVYGPFGDDVLVSDTVTYSNCRSTGLEAFAIGATVWTTERFVYGITLVCAEVTSTCYPPDYPDPTPAPVTDEDDAKWFDAAWEIAITTIGALVTGAAALLLKLACNRLKNRSSIEEQGTPSRRNSPPLYQPNPVWNSPPRYQPNPLWTEPKP